jgi:hypothetical protein
MKTFKGKCEQEVKVGFLYRFIPLKGKENYLSTASLKTKSFDFFALESNSCYKTASDHGADSNID